jgi:serine/threonine protein kinase
MPPANEPDPSIPEQRLYEDTKPIDIPIPRQLQLTGAALRGTSLRVERRIGEGASATVYQGVDRDGSRVAIKVLRYRCNPGTRRRFLQEFEILSLVDSPHVVRARERGELPDGRPWHAMDYVPGRSLAERLARGWRPGAGHVIELLRMACRGLAAVHAAGYVHHDVKPSNLLVVRREGLEHLVVVDLGVADGIGRQPRHMCGTPDYMAPEQAETSLVTVRSDVYGLGCCAYELLCGRKLVGGADATAKIREHVQGVRPSWASAVPMPMALRRLVERCLARDPAERAPSMIALEQALVDAAGNLAAPPAALRASAG